MRTELRQIRNLVDSLLEQANAEASANGSNMEIGTNGEIYPEFLQRFKRALKDYRPANQHSVQEVNLPDAIMWDGIFDWDDVTEDQILSIKGNLNLAFPSAMVGVRLFPMAREAKRGPDGKWVYGALLTNVWTIAQGRFKTMKEVEEQFRRQILYDYGIPV